MARKQKAKGFNKFLDFIGLVDPDVHEDDYDTDYDAPRGRTNDRSSAAFDDGFDDAPRMTHVSSRRDRTTAAHSSASDRFDADEGWGDTTSSRPEYSSARQRSQNQARPASTARYGSEQRFGSSSQNARTARYDAGAQQGEERGRRTSSYQSTYQNSYQPGSYRGSSAYSSATRYAEADNTYSAGDSLSQPRTSGGYQRHQTVIFKLRSVDECKGVILALIEKKSVLLNLDDLDSLQAQRTLDTMSGATFAIGARLSRASDRTWLITPSTVEVADSDMEAGSGYSGRYM